MLTIFLSLLGILSSSIFIVDNLMHSVLLLILTFLTSSLILFLMKIDFLGFAFIIIYVGAIAILFLFVIMMINIKNVENTSPGGLKFFIVVCSCAGLFFNQWSFFFYSQEFFFFNLNMYNSFDFFSSFFYLSQLLYSFYTFSFLIAGLILLVAMIGAILLTMDFSFTNSSQVISKQNSRAGLVTFFCGANPPRSLKLALSGRASSFILKTYSGPVYVFRTGWLSRTLRESRI